MHVPSSFGRLGQVVRFYRHNLSITYIILFSKLRKCLCPPAPCCRATRSLPLELLGQKMQAENASNRRFQAPSLNFVVTISFKTDQRPLRYLRRKRPSGSLSDLSRREKSRQRFAHSSSVSCTSFIDRSTQSCQCQGLVIPSRLSVLLHNSTRKPPSNRLEHVSVHMANLTKSVF